MHVKLQVTDAVIPNTTGAYCEIFDDPDEVYILPILAWRLSIARRVDPDERPGDALGLETTEVVAVMPPGESLTDDVDTYCYVWHSPVDGAWVWSFPYDAMFWNRDEAHAHGRRRAGERAAERRVAEAKA